MGVMANPQPKLQKRPTETDALRRMKKKAGTRKRKKRLKR
jgi:hypothetical protein